MASLWDVYGGFIDGKRLKDNLESIQGLLSENTLFKKPELTHTLDFLLIPVKFIMDF